VSGALRAQMGSGQGSLDQTGGLGGVPDLASRSSENQSTTILGRASSRVQALGRDTGLTDYVTGVWIPRTGDKTRGGSLLFDVAPPVVRVPALPTPGAHLAGVAQRAP
jgi:hypothetical protein